jgi:hypothetical protein
MGKTIEVFDVHGESEKPLGIIYQWECDVQEEEI